MPAQSAPPKLTVLLGDYPHTRPLKDGTIQVPGVEFVFPRVVPLYAAFARMVRTLEFDVCEMALATYLQAREAGIPITLLPVAMIGDTHHQSLTRLPGAASLSPRDLVGQRVGVRSYSQTTGLWVRGILREEYDVQASDVTWITTESPHVEQYRNPPNVHRSATSESVRDLLRDGDVAAAVLGPRAIGAQGTGLVPLIEDPRAAGAAWVERHGTVPVNHLVVVRDDVLSSAPESVMALYHALEASIEATAGERDESPAGHVVSTGWSDQLIRSLQIAGRYAREQDVVRSAVDVAQIEKEWRRKSSSSAYESALILTPRLRPSAPTREPAEWTPDLLSKVEWRRRAAAEPFRGVATSDGVRPDLFPLRSTGVDVSEARQAAEGYLSSLTEKELLVGGLPMDDVTWRHWANGARYFLRHGLLLEDLDGPKRQAALEVMRASLSEAGYRQVLDMMRLNRTVGELRGEEDLLNEWLYWFSLYGEPELGRPWGWQLDGHHVNVNCVFVGDQMTLTPTFLGAEPVTASAGKFVGTTVFRREEAVAQELFDSLTAGQRGKAVIADKLPDEVFVGAFRDNFELDYQGLPLGDLTPSQKIIAAELLGLYVGRASDGHARFRMEEVLAHEGDTHFAWAGQGGPDGVFYYRLHSPVILIEFEHMAGVMFANDVPSRNHIHTVVRTPNGNDYGIDLLRRHHERFHQPPNGTRSGSAA
ncbi:hypothetical protein Caci_3917 [Catenulispora acidiphila DSM 44928]|uniref:DUF3500 domain-containing protein n=1 Tax=Catenulispora acidiphila (strain DSM 44928 / JCM 14897 / NBRC 102108 / NRRL B-24433 / ID139908) TaxID=479433 RepID=C7QEN3_CATAD|nr:DUF3500 domain-containing protein [Catenulispora acidiphila]ACU72803.1 hypothetical protein Caci_3917 [Catenulispora acidiphila DSM 44928]